jgi:hypothetical protein
VSKIEVENCSPTVKMDLVGGREKNPNSRDCFAAVTKSKNHFAKQERKDKSSSNIFLYSKRTLGSFYPTFLVKSFAKF